MLNKTNIITLLLLIVLSACDKEPQPSKPVSSQETPKEASQDYDTSQWIVNEKAKIEKYCNENDIKVKERIWDDAINEYRHTSKYDKQGYLIELDLSDNPHIAVIEIDLRSFKKLNKLTLSRCGMWDSELLKLPESVTELNLSNNGYEKIDLTYFHSLKKLYLRSNLIQNVEKLKLPKSLIELSLERNPISKVRLAILHKLKTLDLANCNFLNLNLSQFPNSLTSLSLSGNSNIKHLNLSHLKGLQILGLGLCNLDNPTLSSFKLPLSLIKIPLPLNRKLSKVNLTHLKNLQTVDLLGCNIEDISLSKFPPKITKLRLNENPIKKINFTQFKNLEFLSIQDTKINYSNLMQLPKTLNSIYIGKSRKKEPLELSHLSNLKKIGLFKSEIEQWNSNKLPKSIEHIFTAQTNKLKSLNFSHLPKLKKLWMLGSSDLSHIQLSNCPNLESLQFAKCKNLNTLNLSDFPNLYEIELLGNNLKTLKLSKLPKLKKLDVKENRNLVQLDLSQLPKLKKLLYTKDDVKLKEILLHPDNQVHPKVTRIKFIRDNKDQLLSVSYFDHNNKPTNDPVSGKAKITYKYVQGIQQVDQSFDAVNLKSFTLKEIPFKPVVEKVYPSQVNEKKKPVLGLVTITNPLKDEAILVDLSLTGAFIQKHYKESHKQIASKLPIKPKESQQIRVYLPFSEKLWANQSDQQVNVTLSVTAQSKSGVRSNGVTKNISFKLMAVNKIVWDDIRNLAPFGSLDDPVIEGLAKAVESLNSVRNSQVPPKIDRALKAYELLRTLQLNYSSMAKGSESDIVKSCSQILKDKTGKCTDTSILYGTLLEKLGYSVLITTFDFKKGTERISHIMLLIDTGVKARDWRFLHKDKNRLVTFGPDSHCYIPVETTSMTIGMNAENSNFLRAWDKGLNQFQKHKDQILNPKNTFRLDTAWRKGFGSMKPKVKREYQVSESTLRNLEKPILELEDEYVLDRLNSEDEYNKLMGKLDLRNYESVFNLAMNLFTVRRYNEAKAYFNISRKLSPNNPLPYYYYSAVLVYLSYSGDKKLSLMEAVSSQNDFKGVLDKLSQLMIQRGQRLPNEEQWFIHYDLSRWFNHIGEKAKAKVHHDLANKVQSGKVKTSIYPPHLIQTLKSKKLSDSLVKKLQANNISYKTALLLINQGFSEKMIHEFVDRGLKDSFLKRIYLKKINKEKYAKYLTYSQNKRFVYNTNDLLIQQSKGFREDVILAIGVKGFSEEESSTLAAKGFEENEVIAIATKGFSEEETVAVAAKGFSEENEIALATKGFSEEDSLASATKGYSEEIWRVTR